MKKEIEAEMRPDHVKEYAGGTMPYVIASTHDRFVVGTRLDWGFVNIALRDGFKLVIHP